MYNTPDFDKQMNMTQGEKALERLRNRASFMAEDYHQDLDIVEKALEKGKEDEKIVGIFKNALTIEHRDLSTVDSHDDSEDIVAYFTRQFFTIKQNELDKSLRQALREWVLKNAFPKEHKVVEIIRNRCVNTHDEIFSCDTYEEYKATYHYSQEKFNLTEEEWKLLREVLVCH